MERIEEFINPDYDGYNYGYGSGYGSGYSSGAGYGSGDGYSSGRGSGSGCGDEDGYSSGAGDGIGGRYAVDNEGYGCGHAENIREYCGRRVYMIDHIATLIDSVRGDMALGRILNRDLTTTKCYIAKRGGFLAHGATLKRAVEDAEVKYMVSLPEEDRLESFRKFFSEPVRYPAGVFFEWHGFLTGSCRLGREEFCKKHNINLKKDSFTVKEFKNIVKGNYGYDLIKQL